MKQRQDFASVANQSAKPRSVSKARSHATSEQVAKDFHEQDGPLVVDAL
jgi:hypothetical protein